MNDLLAKPLVHLQDISFNPYPIEDYLPMEPLDPVVFDKMSEDGWVYWSDLLFKRNYAEWRGQLVRVIMLRIVLEEFSMSKSQTKCFRKNSDLSIRVRPIRVSEKHEKLFERHSNRFGYHKPSSIYGFFSLFSSIQPCTGIEFDIFSGEKLIAISFCHLGQNSMAGNYCIFDPDENHRSLGLLTMLIELQFAKSRGMKYYYPGFVYDTASEFDYKMNFNGLEYFDWWGNWYPLDRLPIRNWKSAAK